MLAICGICILLIVIVKESCVNLSIDHYTQDTKKTVPQLKPVEVYNTDHSILELKVDKVLSINVQANCAQRF